MFTWRTELYYVWRKKMFRVHIFEFFSFIKLTKFDITWPKLYTFENVQIVIEIPLEK